MKFRGIYFILLLSVCTFCTKKSDYIFRDIKIVGLIDSVKVVSAGDLMGSSKDELIIAKDSTIYIYEASRDSALLLYSVPLNNEVLQLFVDDSDNDKKNELVVVTGRRGYFDTYVRVNIIEFENNEWILSEIYNKASPRPQPTYLDVVDYNNDGLNEIIVSYFESKYIIETVSISMISDEWESEVLSQERMAMSRDVGVFAGSKLNRIVVGRVYGDKLGDEGDAYISQEDKIMLPVKRGVKTVKIGDGDNDGENEIYVGDGWHQDYGKVARGRIARLIHDGDEYVYELIEDVKYQYEISQIDIADITNDGKNEILTIGSRYFKMYKYIDEQWTVYSDTIFPNTQYSFGDIYGDKQLEVIFSGEKIKIFNFSNINFSEELDKEVVTERIEPDSLLNKLAPELIIAKWYNGNFGRIHSNRGKVILIDYWATWCKPCIKMFPALKKFQKKYADQGLQIIGLTRLDNQQSIEKIEAFIDNEKFAYPIGLSEESFNNLLYGVGAIPHVVLIDKEGIVRFYEIGLGDETILEREIIKLIEE